MSKLHPIYVALDNHQFNRAIKLALALPDSNILGKALLAHAYSKSGQRFLSLVTLHKILSSVAGPGNYFCELKQEVEYALEAIEEREQQASKPSVNTAPEPSAAKSKGGKKGGKKKPTSSSIPATTTATKEMDEQFLDLLDQLNTRPTLPENWDTLPGAANAITDETTLGTMSVTLNGLKLPLTAYQLYAWAASTGDANETILRKTFCLGLNVLAAPSKWSNTCQETIESHVLTSIQSVALQWAKLYANQPGGLSTFHPRLATAWAAQTALWQLQWLPSDEKRSLILPRLAESMAQRLLQQEETQSKAAEVQLLALRALRQQNKWQEMLEILEKSVSSDVEDQSSPVLVSEFGVALTIHQTLIEKARVLYALEQFDTAREVYEELLAKSPDDWSCWKGHLDCCAKLDNVSVTKELVDLVLSEEGKGNYPLRGPHLMKVELAAQHLRYNSDGAALKYLSSAIQDYSQQFGSRAACVFSDLEVYVELILGTEIGESQQVVEELLDFSQQLRTKNGAPPDTDSCSNKERQSRLRAYIFATKLNHKILAKYVDLQDKWLPDWAELVREWKSTLSMTSSNEGEESQKEIKPGDDLALLAVQLLLYKNHGDVGCQVACATLLEAAIHHSPDNAYLKMSAIYVYYQLDALSRSWEFFQAMNVKHIQLDSCIFAIVPYLMKGALYNEAIEVCNALLRFQASTARDSGDYAGRAMEGGTISKANEFLVFQRQRMNKSLSVLDAKGMILDSAPLLATAVPRNKHDEDPLLKGSLGVYQGIVGGDDDLVRATQMVVEAHNPYAALSLVSWADHGGGIKDCDEMADNRDLSINFQQILFKTPPPSKDEIARDALRRGHVHGLLIRATLSLDAAKGPKKGKIVKSSDQLQKRTKSLLDCVDATSSFIDEHFIGEDTEVVCCKLLLSATIALCRTFAVINAGLPFCEKVDSLEQREERAYDILHTVASPILKQAKQSLVLSVKLVCSLLPNCVVPLFGVFRMCENICNLYGWGKRKHKTKRCAEAMKEVALELQDLIAVMLSALTSLPVSEEVSGNTDFDIKDEHRSLLDESTLKQTLDVINQGRYITRERVEPILQQMDEYLDSFNVNED